MSATKVKEEVFKGSFDYLGDELVINEWSSNSGKGVNIFRDLENMIGNLTMCIRHLMSNECVMSSVLKNIYFKCVEDNLYGIFLDISTLIYETGIEIPFVEVRFFPKNTGFKRVVEKESEDKIACYDVLKTLKSMARGCQIMSMVCPVSLPREHPRNPKNTKLLKHSFQALLEENPDFLSTITWVRFYYNISMESLVNTRPEKVRKFWKMPKKC